MSLGKQHVRTEHAGPKNGGGHWGKRAEAKYVSSRLRRRTWDAEVEATEAADYFWLDYEAQGFCGPRPLEIGTKP